MNKAAKKKMGFAVKYTHVARQLVTEEWDEDALGIEVVIARFCSHALIPLARSAGLFYFASSVTALTFPLRIARFSTA